MRPSRFTEEQIIGMLKEQEAGVATVDVCRKHGISSATFYKFKAKYGGMDVSDARRLKTLEDENARLKKLLAEQMPPGCPVPQALSRSRASDPRTSPMGIRSGRRRRLERTRSESVATPSLVRMATRLGAEHCSSRVSSMMTTRSCVFATSAKSALVSVVLPVDVPPATRMLARAATASRSTVA